VAREVPLGDEVGDDGLLQRRRMAIDRGTRLGERLDQLRRDDDVAQSQRGKERLAEGPHVDHAPLEVHPLQRGEGTPTKAILAIEVVFHHPRPTTTRPLQQRQAACRAERHA
jgi:hypothetical protein